MRPRFLALLLAALFLVSGLPVAANKNTQGFPPELQALVDQVVMAKRLMTAGEYTEAERVYRPLAAVHSEGIFRHMSCMGIARCQAGVGNFAEGRRWLRAALAAPPLGICGQAWLSQEQSIRNLDTVWALAASTEPTRVDRLRSLAEGKNRTAREDWADKEARWEAAWVLGEHFAGQGDLKQAKRYFNQAAQAGRYEDVRQIARARRKQFKSCPTIDVRKTSERE
jgi:hypothetical protein